MKIEQIVNDELYINNDTLVVKIELTHKEAKAIIHSLGRTMCNGEQLTISEELENKLFKTIQYHYHL